MPPKLPSRVRQVVPPTVEAGARGVYGGVVEVVVQRLVGVAAEARVDHEGVVPGGAPQGGTAEAEEGLGDIGAQLAGDVVVWPLHALGPHAHDQLAVRHEVVQRVNNFVFVICDLNAQRARRLVLV
jgi:hypothetical protein